MRGAATHLSSALGDGPCMGGHWSVARVEGPGRELVTSPWRWWCGVRVGGLTLVCVVAGGPSVSSLAPPKFSLPHRAVCFGAGGQLVLVCPHSPAEGQRPLVELHSLEVRPSSQIHPRFPPWSCPFHPIPHPSGLLSNLPNPLLHLVSSPRGLLGLVVPARTWASLSAFGPISCSFGSTTLVLSRACSQRSPSLGVDMVRTSLRDRCAYLSEVLPYGGHTHSLSPPQHFPLLSCLPEEAGAISRTILVTRPHMMV